MNKTELYKRMMSLVPAPPCKVEEFPLKLAERLGRYIDLIEDFDFEGFDGLIQPLAKDEIKSLSSAICEAVKKIYEGQPAQAFNILQYKSSSFDKHILLHTEGHSYYRMRVVDKDKRNINHKEMFHIPYNLRNIVSTQRYSMPGYPCLYLSEHSYGCWEELGRPNLDSCMVSRLENQKALEVWDLRLPKLSSWETAENIRAYLQSFPLVIACMYKVENPNGSFKPEYAIPQLLLELVHNHTDIVGITYTSVYKNRDFKFPDVVFNNFVIPVKDTTTADYCPKLCSFFKITNPTCEEYERIQNGLMLDDTDTEVTSKDLETIRYNHSLFGIIDKKLMIRKDYNLKTIKPKLIDSKARY